MRLGDHGIIVLPITLHGDRLKCVALKTWTKKPPPVGCFCYQRPFRTRFNSVSVLFFPAKLLVRHCVKNGLTGLTTK